MPDLKDACDVEEFVRTHQALVKDLAFAVRSVVHGKFIINLQDGKVIGSEIHRYERRPAKVEKATP